jgi:hypothetical protein
VIPMDENEANLREEIRQWKDMVKKMTSDNELLQDKMAHIQNEVVNYLRSKKIPEKQIFAIIDIFEVVKFDKEMSRSYKRVPQFTPNKLGDGTKQSKLKI